MNWPDERYVRLYTRDTPEWDALTWQARALLPLLLRKVDRAGVLATKKLGVRGMAGSVRLPVEVVEVGIADLLLDGAVALHELGYVIPNFLAAQEVHQSSKARMAKLRWRRRGPHGGKMPDDPDDGESDVAKPSSDAAQPDRYATQQSVAPLVRLGTARLGRSGSAALDPDHRPHLAIVPADPDKPKKATKKLKVTLPDDWAPNEKHAERAARFGINIALEADKMRAWAAAGGEQCVSWDARFDGWLLRASDFKSERAKQQPTPRKIPIA